MPVLVLASACVHFTVLSREQLEQRGTRHYPTLTVADAVTACSQSLRTLGYDVTIADPKSGVVKTSPKVVSESASGGPGYANVTRDGIAWAVAVAAEGDGVVVRLTPRAFRNGSEMRGDGIWVAEVMDSKFSDIWAEIDSSTGPTRSAR